MTGAWLVSNVRAESSPSGAQKSVITLSLPGSNLTVSDAKTVLLQLGVTDLNENGLATTTIRHGFGTASGDPERAVAVKLQSKDQAINLCSKLTGTALKGKKVYAQLDKDICSEEFWKVRIENLPYTVTKEMILWTILRESSNLVPKILRMEGYRKRGCLSWTLHTWVPSRSVAENFRAALGHKAAWIWKDEHGRRLVPNDLVQQFSYTIVNPCRAERDRAFEIMSVRNTDKATLAGAEAGNVRPADFLTHEINE
ncbi:hypothetical protein HDU93_008319 [Gonapodya sp. JEL0774]|nr:hypothetical protein HDU93_008319 [Gonapodya sp. JEL0774]